VSSKDFYSTPIIPTGAMAGTATIYGLPANSQAFDIRYQVGCSFAVVWTGTPTVTLSVQVSNDFVPNLQSTTTPINAGTWYTIQASITPQPAGSAGQVYIPVYGIVASYIRLVYLNSSGTGVLSGQFTSKTWG
jgi:hypothetical protein